MLQKSHLYKPAFTSAIVLLLLVMTGNLLFAQENDRDASVSIVVSATVDGMASEVIIVTLRDMNLDQQLTRAGVLEVNPVTDGEAGKIRAEGMPNAEVRISFLSQRELLRDEGAEYLTFYYRIAGNDIDDQASAEILDLDNRDYTLNEDGEFYFWIGGEVDLRNAVHGAYDGEFTVEIEYLES